MIQDLDRLMEIEGVDSIIAVGTAFDTPDIFWLTGFRSPDSIIVLHNHGSETLVATGFHAIDRVTKEGFIKRTFDLTEVYRDMMKQGKRAVDNPEMELKPLLDAEFSGNVIGAPDHLPASMLIAIQNLGYQVKPVPNLLKNARSTKSPREIDLIRKAGEATIGAISQVIEMIKDSDVGSNGTLMRNRKELTVRDIKLALDHLLLDHDAESAEDAIIAVGTKAFDWHYLGEPTDKLKANVPIIMDVFPRLKKDFYVADVTRTVVKGKPEARVREMHNAIIDAAGAVEQALTDGANIDDVNLECFNTLKKHGFDSSRLNPNAVDGMTHGLGHGIGLQVHENPSLYKRDAHYKEGHVVAIEPGVYLKEYGGVRFENDYVVTKGRPQRTTLGLDDAMYL